MHLRQRLRRLFEPQRAWSAVGMWVRLVAGVLFVVAVATAGWALAGSAETEYPAWLEATSTLAAFIAALIAVRYAAAAFGLEAQRDRDRDLERRTRQASMVAGWFEVETRPVVTSAVGRSIASRRVPGLLLRNASDVPVYRLQFEVWMGPVRLGLHHLALLPPASEPRFEPLPQLAFDTWKSLTEDISPEHQSVLTFDVALVFTDASGQRWERGRDGVLTDEPKNLWFADTAPHS